LKNEEMMLATQEVAFFFWDACGAFAKKEKACGLFKREPSLAFLQLF